MLTGPRFTRTIYCEAHAIRSRHHFTTLPSILSNSIIGASFLNKNVTSVGHLRLSGTGLCVLKSQCSLRISIICHLTSLTLPPYHFGFIELSSYRVDHKASRNENKWHQRSRVGRKQIRSPIGMENSMCKPQCCAGLGFLGPVVAALFFCSSICAMLHACV